MSGYKKINGQQVFVIEAEQPDTCEYCGAHKETRLYGKNGARICFQCAMKDENKQQTGDNFKMLLDNPPSEKGN